MIKQAVAVEGKGGKRGFVSRNHPEGPQGEADLVKKEVDVLAVVPNQSQDVSKVIVVTGDKRKIKGEVCVLPKAKSPVGGKVQGGPLILYVFVIVKC